MLISYSEEKNSKSQVLPDPNVLIETLLLRHFPLNAIKFMDQQFLRHLKGSYVVDYHRSQKQKGESLF